MGNKTAEVSGDAGGVFANAKSAGRMIDYPRAQDGIIAVKTGQRRERLVNETFFAVLAGSGQGLFAVFDQRNIRPFPRELGFARISCLRLLLLKLFQSKISREEVRMIRVFLPEDG